MLTLEIITHWALKKIHSDHVRTEVFRKKNRNCFDPLKSFSFMINGSTTHSGEKLLVKIILNKKS